MELNQIELENSLKLRILKIASIRSHQLMMCSKLVAHTCALHLFTCVHKMLKSNKLGFAYSAFQFTPGLVHDKSMTLSSVKCKCEMPNFVQ